MSKGTFNCNGKVNINDWQLNGSSLFLQKEVDNVLNEKKSCSSLTLKIFNCELPGINVLLNLKHFVQCMEAKLKQLGRYEKLTTFGKQSSTTNNTDFFSTRKMVSEFLFYLRDCLQSIKEENFALKDVSDEVEKSFDDLLSTIFKFLSRLQHIPDSTFLYATSNVGNKCNQPEYHMYHMHLDLRWLIITLIYVQNNAWGSLNNNSEDLENSIYKVIGDLIYISMKIFATIPNLDLRSKAPYSCTCVRELWVMLQILTDTLHTKGKCKIFWNYVNTILNQLLPYEFNKDAPTFQGNLVLPHCKNPELFCIWLIHHLTLLYGYRENGDYSSSPSNRFQELQIKSNIDAVEKILKAYVNKGGKDGARDEIDEELCVILPLLHVLTFEWWNPRVQIMTLLWDCFHRRLDQPFLMQTRGPWSASSEKKTPMDILEQVRDRIKYTNEINNESSFGLFLRFLGIFLQKNYTRTDLKVWNQIKGRIFSRFSQNKIQEFSESGLYNFISLFLTLAVNADTTNVCSAMVNLLPSVLEWTDSTGGKKCCLAWKGKLAVLILYNEQKLSFNDFTESFTETANAISCRKDEFSRSMMTWFIDVLRIIIMQSEDFGHYEYAFLGGWIDRYLLESAPNKVGVLTNTLLQVFEKCNDLQNINTMGTTSMLNSLWNHVASRVRQMVTTCDLSTDFYENPTKLAVAFTLDACRDPITAKKYRHSAVSLFQHFTTSVIIKDIRITRLYLTQILKNDAALQHLKKEIPNFNISCIQAWIKCSILNFEVNSETNFLKNYIANLPEIKDILNSDRDINEFLNSNETIISFLMMISKKRSILQFEHLIASFDSQCRPYFHNLDKWALQLINEENKDTKLSLWIFRCLGTIILCCSTILYVKNQPNNMLRMLINKVALPSDQNQLYLTHLSQRIFSMIILGIENLNIKSDISLKTLIRELFERYLPLLITVEGNNENSFKVADTLCKCFLEAKPNFIHSILDMLACNFIIVPGGNSTHKHCYLVMLLLRNLIRAGKMYPINIIDSTITICTPLILNCYMKVHDHHPHKQQTVDFLRDLSTNSYLKENLSAREKLNEAVWSVLKKYTISSSKICFELLSSTFRINSELFRYLHQRVEQLVSECEKNKRPNAAALRYSLNSIKKSIELLKSKF